MLSKKNRLRKEKNIQNLFSSGEGVFDDVCGVKYKKNGRSQTRFAVIVGKRISKKAVVRNRVRRRVREIIRHHFDEFESGYDVALLVQKKALNMDYDALDKRVMEVLQKTPVKSE